jgi:hypothetical protein
MSKLPRQRKRGRAHDNADLSAYLLPLAIYVPSVEGGILLVPSQKRKKKKRKSWERRISDLGGTAARLLWGVLRDNSLLSGRGGAMVLAQHEIAQHEIDVLRSPTAAQGTSLVYKNLMSHWEAVRHGEFMRLLFLQAHRETDRFFAASRGTYS